MILLPLLSILAAPVLMAADAAKERSERLDLRRHAKRMVIKIMEQLGIPPG